MTSEGFATPYQAPIPGSRQAPHHPGLAAGRWFELTLVEQLANVGSEIERALTWAAKGNQAFSLRAFERGLELLELTMADPRHRHRLKEPARVREALLDYFLGENQYGSTDEGWRRYFFQFALAAAIQKERRGRVGRRDDG